VVATASLLPGISDAGRRDFDRPPRGSLAQNFLREHSSDPNTCVAAPAGYLARIHSPCRVGLDRQTSAVGVDLPRGSTGSVLGQNESCRQRTRS
jgi:hypothetical protein